ncbi:uncharacterized protein EURHEDRAFT_523390 [Aspergillus ruber CBS 135680]|uniref:Uncharacterized protein n=1 Tax=Aspergillus ruber (strain CBS 135680) TaxID=1388766 RepID=A0A017SDZ3_ASPRC|nr:uncharacterized protein EURHEDRAFT_523390 [Aspergillus ruber CBS 135680]EYE95233.1 hypothetical protein EURHEDRAFT_523390 [Aspergillus ruber CBS 135680]
MLDENLPTFYLKHGQNKHSWVIYLCHHGDEPTPAYHLRYPDPSSPSSKNRYAVALCDPYVPEIIYGEVLLIPEWTQPSLSADAIRANGGVTPPPEPILPSQFVVHLYNPDQEIVVRYKPKTWNSPAMWDFEMPQHTFRQPSSSTLDRTQIDPAIADVTPKLRFGWRKDSKLSKDLACLLSGKTASIPETKTKSKEPDITISIFKGLRELTLYEPNLYRVEMEDFKGLECVLLLGAVTIRDVFFTSIEKAFSISHDVKKPHMTPQNALAVQKPIQKPGPSTASVAPALASSNKAQPQPQYQPQQPPAMSGALVANNKPHPTGQGPQRPRITIPQQTKPLPEAVPQSQPQPQPRSQQQQQQQQQQQPQQVRFSPGTKPDDDLRRQKKAQEANDKARRKKQIEIEKETKRLQKIYGREEEQVRKSQQQRPTQPRPQPQPQPQRQPQRPTQHRPMQSHPSSSRPHLPPRPGPGPSSGPYLHAPPSQAGPNRRPNAHASVQFLPLQPQHVSSPALQQKKSSFFGLRRSSEEKNKEKLAKKRSSMF